MNKLDNIIEKVAPGWALRRTVSRNDLNVIKSWGNSAYSSGNTNSARRKHAAYGRSHNADEETNAKGYGYDAMRLEAMDLYRNNPIARSLVETTRRYCRQSRPRANTAGVLERQRFGERQVQAASEWDEQSTDYFNFTAWKRSDALKRPGVTFGTLQDIFITTQFTQGDLAYVWTGDGFLTVEGLQIRTPYPLARESNIKHGFRFNARGQITHMYVCEFENGYINANKFTRYPIQSVIYCPWIWRAAQLRAVPRLHGVIDSLRDNDTIHDLVKQKIENEASLLSIERAGSRKKAPGSKLTGDDGVTTTYEKAQGMMRFKTTGKPNEDFMFAKGDTPSAQYVGVMEYDAKVISAGCGIPYKILMSLYDGSWSSNKAAQAALKMFVKEIHQHRQDVFCQRAYNVITADAIRKGILPPAPTNNRGVSIFSVADWTQPYFPQLDIQKEESGRSASFQNMTQSIDDWADEQGTSADALFRNHKRNIERLKKDADELGIPLETYAGGLLAKSTSISNSNTNTTTEVTDEI